MPYSEAASSVASFDEDPGRKGRLAADDDDSRSLLGSLCGGVRTSGVPQLSIVGGQGHVSKELVRKQRPRSGGPGLRIRPCDLCNLSSSSPDPCVEGSFMIWSHMESDGVTVQGGVCHYCKTILRRRWKGWRVQYFKCTLASNETVSEQFQSLRKRLVEGYKIGSDRVSSVSLDAPQQSVAVGHSMEEKFELKGWLFLPRHVYSELFKVEGESNGLKEEKHNFPDGSSLVGFRVVDDGKRPLPHPDIVPISRVYRKAPLGIKQETMGNARLREVGALVA